MHILINGLLLSPRPSGIGHYIVNLTEAMAGRLQPHERITLVIPRDLAGSALPLPARIDLVRAEVPCSRPRQRIWWEQRRLPALATQRQATVVFSPAYALPLRMEIPGVVTIHDLAFLRYRDVHPRLNRWYLTWITHASVRRAQRIIAVSESTKQELIELLAVQADRISVIYNGVADRFRPVPESEREAVRKRYQLPQKYILYVGNLEPRKNLPFLLQAFDRLKQNESIPHHLVILGQRAWLHGSIDATLRTLRAQDHVLFPGYVPSEDLPALYSLADIFVYPSLYEGFGLPVLEAMACGTPVITSATSSLPEVAGDAAELVDPHSVTALSDALFRLATDANRREQLIRAGLQRAKVFSWTRAAEETLDVLREVNNTAKRKSRSSLRD